MLQNYFKKTMRRQRLLIIALSLLIAGCAAQSKNPFIKGPYLQNLKQTEMTIAWESDTTDVGKVHYGIENSLDKVEKAAESLKVQKVVLKNLEPETEYSYQVEVNKFKSEKNSFRTAVRENSSFTFAAYGDNKNGPFNHKKLADLILTYKPLFVANNGDLVDRGYVYRQWEKLFFTPAHKMMANIPLVPAIGNHEKNADYYYDYFCLPNHKAWFSFNIDGAHFVVVNTEGTFLMDSDEQINCLINDLKNNRATWTFVFQHVPPFTSGGNYYSNSRIKIKNLLHPIYEKYGVDMVVCGHDHHYERSKPVGSMKSDHAVTYIVGGNGGTPMRYIGRPKNFSLKSTRTFGFCLVEIDGTKLKFKEISIDNTVRDEFQLDKDDPESMARYLANKINFEDIEDPVEASKLYSKGKKLYKQDNYREALKFLLEAYNVDKYCEEATAMIAQCYYELDDYDNARKFAEITIENAPLHPDSYEVIASIYKKQKKYDEAIRWFKKQFSVQPDTPNALEDIAGIYDDLEKYDLAVATYRQAIAVLPNDWEIHFDLAQLYEKLGKEKKALKEYQQAVEWFYDEKVDEDYLIAIEKVKELSK